jgi:hypothetical protein
LEGEPTWVELYKAYEALRGKFSSCMLKDEIRRFAQTANAKDRHHQNGKYRPPKRPMELGEGRAFIKQWVSSAVDDILARSS